MHDRQTKRQRRIGSFASEEDAARAYDYAAVQKLGSGAKLNFPSQTISELPVSLGEERKQRSSSRRYIGVSWHKGNSSFQVMMTDPQTKRQRFIGCFASEEDAAWAYDRAAVEAGKPDAKLNFPGETISELPVSSGGVRKRKGSISDVPAKKKGRRNGSEEQQDGSEEQQDGSEEEQQHGSEEEQQHGSEEQQDGSEEQQDGSEEEQDGSEGSEEASQVPLEFLGPDEVPGYGCIALLKELVAVAAMLGQQQ
jgi:hypothetical protein